MDKIIQRSFVHALGVIAYIGLVAAVMINLEQSMKEDTIWVPIMMLTLFVLSAAITSSLVLGKPVMMYMAGDKKDAIKLFAYTLGWLAIAFVILLLINLR